MCTGVMEGGALCDVRECEECGVGGYQHLCVCGGGSSVLYQLYNYGKVYVKQSVTLAHHLKGYSVCT